MKQTAMQEHIEWLKVTIEIAEEQYPILVNTLKLCLNDATQRLAMEKEHMHKCASFWRGKENEIEKPIFEQYYNETFKSE